MLSFVNITEEEFLRSKILYKHLSLENALKTLETKTLWFASPTDWKDPFERRFLEAKYQKAGKDVEFRWRKRVFCTCITRTQTSEAFWFAYSHGEIGIEFRIDSSTLLKELKKHQDDFNIFIGKVEYMRTEEIKRGLKQIPFNPPITVDINTNEFAARLFLLKRIAFKYEDEMRVIILKNNQTTEKGIELDYSCENTDLIKQIVIDPNVGEYTYKLISENFIDDFGFTPFGNDGKISNRVIKSQIYTAPKPAILKLD